MMTVKFYLKYTIFSGAGNIGTNIIVYLLCSRNYTRQHKFLFYFYNNLISECQHFILTTWNLKWMVQEYTTNIWQRSFHGLYISPFALPSERHNYCELN